MAVLAMGATGCSDFLDKQPSNEMNEDKTYADWKMFEAFHVDTYNFLLHGANRINGSWLDAATDLAETSFSTGGTLTTFNIGNYYGAERCRRTDLGVGIALPRHPQVQPRDQRYGPCAVRHNHE